MNNIVLYDANCNLCKNIKIIFSKIDFLNCFNWISIEEYKLKKYKLLDFDFSRLDSSFAVINKSNNIFFEFEGCKYLITRIPLLWPLIIFFYIPYISNFFGTLIYKKISKNRICNQK